MDTNDWRPVVGYPLYEINPAGDVRRRAENGRPPGNPLTPQAGRGGYPQVHLSLGGGRQKSLKVHRALVEAFIGPAPAPRMFVLHEDDDPTNISLDNLRWGTRRENADDAKRNGGTAQIAAWRRERTKCKRGHEYNSTNTSIRRRNGYTFRDCLVCRREDQARYLERQRLRVS